MPPKRRALTALALAVALGLAMPARPGYARSRSAASLRPAAFASRSAAPKLTSRARQGHVEFVTQHRVYLDRGGADGLGLHQAVQLLRNGRPVGRCTIEALSDHAASCRAGRARIGDAFRLARAVATPAAVARPLPPPAPDEALQARADASPPPPSRRWTTRARARPRCRRAPPSPPA
jgi:hypothetical protein